MDVLHRDKLILQVGPSFGDYLFGSERIDTVPNVLEPNGYLFYLGPAFRGSYLLSKSMFVDAFLRYDLSVKAMGRDDAENLKGDYPNAHFLTLGAAFITSDISS